MVKDTKKNPRDYYAEIDRTLKTFERGRYDGKGISWVTNRIDWCWKFRKITQEQMSELCERVIYLFDHSENYRLYPHWM